MKTFSEYSAEYQELDEGVQEWIEWLKKAGPAIARRFARFTDTVKAMGDNPTHQQFEQLGRAAAPDGEEAFLSNFGIGQNQRIESAIFEEKGKGAIRTILLLSQFVAFITGTVIIAKEISEKFALSEPTIAIFLIIGYIIWALVRQYIVIRTSIKGPINKPKPRRAREV